jgi:hypothetical protein
MDQAFGHIPDSVKHEHVSTPEARFAPGTYLCTVCVGRALVMALATPGEGASFERINAALDFLRDSSTSGTFTFDSRTFGGAKFG